MVFPPVSTWVGRFGISNKLNQLVFPITLDYPALMETPNLWSEEDLPHWKEQKNHEKHFSRNSSPVIIPHLLRSKNQLLKWRTAAFHHPRWYLYFHRVGSSKSISVQEMWALSSVSCCRPTILIQFLSIPVPEVVKNGKTFNKQLGISETTSII